MSDNHIIRSTLVPEDQRLDITAGLFGVYFPLRLEPIIYGIADRMAPEYHGGYWHFYDLNNGGFYMAPDNDRCFLVQCSNCWQGELSADALGITACLTAYSYLSFGNPEAFARRCATHYHLLREYMMEHGEVSAILSATD